IRSRVLRASTKRGALLPPALSPQLSRCFPQPPVRAFSRSEPRLDAPGRWSYGRRPFALPVKLLSFRPLLLAPALALFSPAAGATELTWEGYYRARGRFFDSLSVANSASLDLISEDQNVLETEGVSLWMDHRMRLQPNWLLSEHASLHAQLDLLGFLNFGDQPETITDPVSGDPLPPE